MDIEVRHDPLNLPAKKLIQVTSARGAELKLNRFCDTKDARGYKLRYVPDYATNTLELGARWSYNVNMAIRCLQDAGIYIKEIQWATNKLLT